MVAHASRLGLSLEPLIAEARRRARLRRTSVAAILAGGAAVAILFAVRPAGPNGAAAPRRPAASHTALSTLVLEPAAPRAARAYLRIHGPAGAVAILARSNGAYFDSHHVLGGLTFAGTTHGTARCSAGMRLPGYGLPGLRRYAGQTVTFTAYGEQRYAHALCRWINSR